MSWNLERCAHFGTGVSQWLWHGVGWKRPSCWWEGACVETRYRHEAFSPVGLVLLTKLLYIAFVFPLNFSLFCRVVGCDGSFRTWLGYRFWSHCYKCSGKQSKLSPSSSVLSSSRLWPSVAYRNLILLLERTQRRLDTQQVERFWRYVHSNSWLWLK